MYRATTPCGTYWPVLLGSTLLALTVPRCLERLYATWASDLVT